MFKISTELDLLDCFRPLERGDVELPDCSYPLVVKDYFAWSEPGGAKAFLVFSDRLADRSAPPLGVVFRRGEPSPIAMCEWCHAIGGGAGVGLLTASASANRRVGVHACLDFSCIEKIRSNPGMHDFPRSRSERQQIRELLERMGRFARQNLF